MKIIKNVIITIVLGALGSALWEIFLKKLFSLIYDRIVLYAFQFFNDSFYAKVAYSIDSPAFYTYYYFMLLTALFFLLLPDGIHAILKSKLDSPHISIFKCIIVILFIYEAFIVSFSNSTARRTLNNIEIIAPYISDMDYKTLKSNFYQMDSKSDYIQIISMIESVASENDLKIQ